MPKVSRLLSCAVDLDKGTLRVEHSLTHTGQGQRQLGETKTEKSRRSKDLPALAVEALRAQRKQQMAEQARAGAEGFRWCDEDGFGVHRR